MEVVQYAPIGFIHTPFKDTAGMPIQPLWARGVKGTVNIDQDYIDGLVDLAGFSHIILIYHFHLSKGFSLRVKPFLDDNQRGVFATRSPRRPNQIGITVVRLESIEGATLHIQNIDVVDGTPLLDIKPFVPEFNFASDVRIGWLENRLKEAKDHDRGYAG